MDCQLARSILDFLHGFVKTETEETAVRIASQMDAALNHISECPSCRLYIYEEVCPMVKEHNDKSTMGEDGYMAHGMLHGSVLKVHDCIAAPIYIQPPDYK